MPRGHSVSIYARFSAKKRTSLYIGDHCYIQTRHNNLFFFSHYNLFLGEGKEKLARKARVNTLLHNASSRSFFFIIYFFVNG